MIIQKCHWRWRSKQRQLSCHDSLQGFLLCAKVISTDLYLRLQEVDETERNREARCCLSLQSPHNRSQFYCKFFILLPSTAGWLVTAYSCREWSHWPAKLLSSNWMRSLESSGFQAKKGQTNKRWKSKDRIIGPEWSRTIQKLNP